MNKEAGKPDDVSQLARFAAVGEVIFVLILANVAVLVLKAAGVTPGFFGVSGDDVLPDARTGLEAECQSGVIARPEHDESDQKTGVTPAWVPLQKQ